MRSNNKIEKGEFILSYSNMGYKIFTLMKCLDNGENEEHIDMLLHLSYISCRNSNNNSKVLKFNNEVRHTYTVIDIFYQEEIEYFRLSKDDVHRFLLESI